MQFLDFKDTDCKNCYKCLRECPVKAISVLNHQAKINDNLCVLCGKCTDVCHQNAKHVRSEKEKVLSFLSSGKKVIASVAPSFVSNFDYDEFYMMKNLLTSLGFWLCEETARGARIVVDEYKKILDSKTHVNLIASACPSIVRLIQIYHSEALPYLAMVDSPMVAHAKLLRKEHGNDVCIVFIGPCISKKREAYESGIIDGVLTFEELDEILRDKDIKKEDFNIAQNFTPYPEKAKFFPINRGIIKSFNGFTEGYEYISIDGMQRCIEVLNHISDLKGMFIEMNACEFSCVNGPCILNKRKGGFIKATESIRKYTKSPLKFLTKTKDKVDISNFYKSIKDNRRVPTEKEILDILSHIGKNQPSDQLDCGSCGYATCKDKAIAVYNGHAELEICLPYMRERAESLSIEIIKNSPNGIIAVDQEMKIVDINKRANEFLGITENNIKGKYLVDYYNPTDFFICLSEEQNIKNKKIFVPETNKYLEASFTFVPKQKVIFCIMKDITTDVNYDKQLSNVKAETIETTTKVIEKQMRVAQEIASLLGETTAETKIALIKLRNTLQKDNDKLL